MPAAGWHMAELYVLNDEYTRQRHLTTVTDDSSVAATEL